jgi:UDP-glucose 4-epimerase
MTGQYAELRIYGTDWDTEDGTAVRDFIHVTDLAQGHIAALNAAIERKLDENFRTFNLGTGCGHSVLDVVNAMEQASSRPIPRITAERRAGDVGSCVAAVDRSRQELQWKTEKSLEDACADICKFLELSYLA